MFKIRRVQNKPKRETNDIKNSELQEMRRENQKLKRELARLRRELQKSETFDPKQQEIADETLSKKIEKSVLCPDCGSDQLTQIQFSIKVFTVCKLCKWRKAN